MPRAGAESKWSQQDKRSVRDRSSKRQPGRDRNAPRWHGRGIVRPTPSGFLALALGGLCCFLAILLDDRMLSAATLALWLALLASLAIALLQRRFVTADLARAVMAASQLPQTRDGLVAYVPARGWKRFLLPHSMFAALQWERLDQRGRVVGRGAGKPPEQRGLYRHAGIAATWSDPFGLIRQRLMLPDDGETMILPAESGGGAETSLASDARLQDQSAGEMASSVRQYAPGDSPRLISWRHTAHRGELMTRESDRDVHVTTLLVIDMAADLDAAAAYALQRLRATQSKGLQVAVSDGEIFHGDRHEATRFLAAMRPWDQAGAGEGSRATSPAPTVERQVAAIAQFAAAQRQPLRIVLVAAADHTPLSAALDASPLGSRTSVHAVGPAREDGDRAAIPCIAIDSGGSAAQADSVASDDDAGRHPWRRHLVRSRVVTAAALIVLHIVTLLALKPMVELHGLWPITSITLLVAVTVEAVLFPPATAWRSARRVLVGSLIIVLVSLGAMIVRIHATTGMWVIGRRMEQVTDEQGRIIEQVAHWNFELLPDAIGAGMNELYVQLPPLTVGPYADVLLIGAGAIAAILLRCALVQPVAAPALAVVPVAVMSTAFAFVGQTPSYAMIGVTVCAAILLLWSTVPVRAIAPLPVIASGVATAIVLALTPSATSLAIAIPLAVGTPGGLFSTSTVNPMVDLKRGLNTGSSATVFTYTSRTGSPYYFRLATLDDFNGDTWKYDPQLASDGGLYGGRPNFGSSPKSDPLVQGLSGMPSDDVRDLDPFMRTWYAVMSSYGSSDIGYSDDDLRSLVGMRGSADVSIDSLASRFLPVVGNVTSISGVDNRDQQSWYQADDGTIFSTGTLTSSGMNYSASGAYIAPISGNAGFGQLTALDNLRKTYIDYYGTDSISAADREATRRALAASGYGTIVGDYLVVRIGTEVVQGADDGQYAALNGSSGRGPMVRLTGPDGQLISNAEYPMRYLDGMIISFNSAFRRKLALSGDEMIMQAGNSSKTRLALVLRLDGAAMSRYTVQKSDEYKQALDDAGAPSNWYGLIPARSSGSNYYGGYGYDGYGGDSSGYGGSGGSYGGSGGGSDGSGSGLSGITASRRVSITPQDLYDTGTGASLRSRYGGLPSQLPEHVRAVIEEAKAAGVPADGTTEEAQVAAMRWLVNYFSQPGFVYSLTQPDGNGRNNLEVVDDFLVDKSGYCTHYATALAVLARGLGLSTRIVLGYNQGGAAVGDTSTTGGSDDPGSGAYGGSGNGDAFIPWLVNQGRSSAEYQVQAKQLHSWTEVYIDNIGWVPFDVTPSADGTDIESGDDTGVTTINPSAAASSSSASASASASESSTATEEETTTDESTDAAAQTTGTTAVQSRVELPQWAVVTLWTLFGLALACALALTPAGIRARRRGGRMRLIDQAIAVGDDDALNRRAWRAAWAEAADCARDAGLSWPATATDRDVQRLIAERFPDERLRLSTLAEGAIAAAYGAPSSPVEPLDAAVPQILESLRSRLTTVQRLVPRSLFRSGL